MSFGGLIQNKKNKNGQGLGVFPQPPGQDAEKQNVDLMALLSQPQSFGTQSPNLNQVAAHGTNPVGGETPDLGVDYGVPASGRPGYSMLPPVNGEDPYALTPEEMSVGSGGAPALAGSPVSAPIGMGSGRTPNPVQPLAPMKLPQRKDKGGFFNFTGSDNVFLRGAQGLEDGGILGLIGQILNR